MIFNIPRMNTMEKEVILQKEIKMLIIKRTRTNQPTFITLSVPSQSLLSLPLVSSLLFSYLLMLHTVSGNLPPHPMASVIIYILKILKSVSQSWTSSSSFRPLSPTIYYKFFHLKKGISNTSHPKLNSFLIAPLYPRVFLGMATVIA